ncbi:hypothetical protein C0992_001541 [Termitomyces sp. T32_za158]|nr:hypothetical protein C0992_001541 [Termitomyces sp. T32_za158]
MAHMCFDAILAARLLVLLCLLAAYEDRVGKLIVKDIPQLKKYWLFIQLDNRILEDEDCSDLFLELSTLLCHIERINATIGMNSVLLNICKSFLGGINTRMYCVLDEAQVAADAYPDAFRDSRGDNSRPVLRAMLKVWLDLGMRHVITGTSLNLEHINDAISSTVGKYANKLKEAVTDTGSFVEDGDQIAKFLRHYLPSAYLDSPSGKELIKRAQYWLCGRPRFIASYVACLIEHDLQFPHQILTKYIKTMTNFAPADGEFWEKLEEPMPWRASLPIRPFDFSRAGNLQSDLAEAVKRLVCHRLINGCTDFERSGAGLVEVDLVECGFARYPSATDRPVFDEPLAYLAADFWITAHRKSKHAYFVERIHQNALNNNGLEQYTAICLAHIFRDYTPLSAYFDFSGIGGNRRLADKKARLVSCWMDSSGSFRLAPVFSPFEICLDRAGCARENASSPANILGYNSKDLWEDLSWLEFRLDAPFLFPQNEFGPDLIFRLQLEGGELLTVALQTKYKEYASSLEDPLAIQSAVDSVNPDRFYKNKRGQPHAFQELPQLVLNALDQLPNRYCAYQKGYHSVLCGLFACPTVSISGSKPAYKKVLEEINSGSVTVNPCHEFFVVKFDAIRKLTRHSKPREALDRLADALRDKKIEKLFMQGEMGKKKFFAKLAGKKGTCG